MMIRICALFFFLTVQVWAGISINIDPPTVKLGESFRINLSYDPSQVQGAPDLTALQDEFSIIGTEQSMSYSVINGQAQSIGQWSIVLQPRKTGIILIPAIKIGHLSSPPSQISVNPAAQSPDPERYPKTSAKPNKAGVQLTASVDQTKPYLNQEVLYTVRLSSQHQLVNLRYHPPEAQDAIVFRVGEGQEYQRIIDGELTHVIEQLYAIFPQKSGELSISPPRINALIYEDRPKPIALSAETQRLKVQAPPQSQSLDHWLPSKLVKLKQVFDQTTDTFEQGASLTRTIDLQAQGLVAKLLPEIPFEKSKLFSVYPAKAQTTDEIKQGELWGQSRQNMTYVFTKAGDIDIPAIQVPWFNVNTKQLEIAKLPGRRLHILPYANPNPEKGLKTPNPKHQSLATTEKPQADKPSLVQNTRAYLHGPFLLRIGLGLAVLGLMLVGLILFYRTRPKQAATLTLLKKACQENDPQKARAALLTWARQLRPDLKILDLAAIAKFTMNDQLNKELALLDAALYQKQACADWQGQGLWRALNAWRHSNKSQAARHKKSTLPPIYPT